MLKLLSRIDCDQAGFDPEVANTDNRLYRNCITIRILISLSKRTYKFIISTVILMKVEISFSAGKRFPVKLRMTLEGVFLQPLISTLATYLRLWCKN